MEGVPPARSFFGAGARSGAAFLDAPCFVGDPAAEDVAGVAFFAEAFVEDVPFGPTFPAAFTERVLFGAAFFGAAFFAGAFLVGAFFGAAFLVGAFFAALFFAALFFAAVFLAADFFGGAFFTRAFFAGAFFTGAFFARAFRFGALFFAGAFLVVAFFAIRFLAVGFLAAPRFTGTAFLPRAPRADPEPAPVLLAPRLRAAPFPADFARAAGFPDAAALFPSDFRVARFALVVAIWESLARACRGGTADRVTPPGTPPGGISAGKRAEV